MIAEAGLIVERGVGAGALLRSALRSLVLGFDLGVVLLDGVPDGHADLPGIVFCATERGKEIGHERN